MHVMDLETKTSKMLKELKLTKKRFNHNKKCVTVRPSRSNQEPIIQEYKPLL